MVISPGFDVDGWELNYHKFMCHYLQCNPAKKSLFFYDILLALSKQSIKLVQVFSLSAILRFYAMKHNLTNRTSWSWRSSVTTCLLA